MASKSRLGRGLGALFPTLPDEQEFQHEAQAVKPEPAKRTTARKTAKKAPSKPAKAATGPKKAPYDPEAYADVDGPISPLSSTIPSMGAMTIHAETVNKLSAPMTLQPQAAEHHVAQQPDRPSSPVKTHGKRATMPAISSMTHHPSDMFFDGTPLANTAKPKEEESEAPELKPVAGGYLVELNPNQIGPNLYQPRTTFNEEELQELADSIKEVGVLQPIVVRKRPQEQIDEAKRRQSEEHAADRFAGRMDSEYELIMGERRWRASQLAGLTEIPVIVKTTSDEYMLRDALLENLHRVALNPLEEAAAYQQMIDEFGLTQKQLAQSVSKSRPQIANTLRLMNLPASVQKKVAAGQLSSGHARALLGLDTDAEMEQLAQRIIDEGLSVRSVEEIVSMSANKEPRKPKTNRNNPWAGSPIQQHLSERFATKVSIKGSEQHGRIEIVFSSPEEMQRIIDLLG
ncbi:ParB/RepB/Spo0J family partition protein [Bifidobacterium animalis]|uniref:ParB/RepB/Spo0J family partition protein n=1 Tax=Bifidobacterium animalis TaxID=28025 RepID=UPI0006995AAB|nr:ParB/RepB/Spo0J family partition protein [Bifidobacterium animalis]KOA56267.1 chromosome partitioning protein ParB [Bifidobacterium animalis subsp. animalis ATCC 27672]